MPDLIYPSLPAHRVFGVLRIGGNGLGNCLFAYFHAVVMAKEHGGRVVAPTWWSVDRAAAPPRAQSAPVRQNGSTSSG